MRYIRNILILVLIACPSVRAQHAKNPVVLKDGTVYTGQMKLGKPNGTGRTDYVNGDVYEGAFEKGAA